MPTHVWVPLLLMTVPLTLNNAEVRAANLRRDRKSMPHFGLPQVLSCPSVIYTGLVPAHPPPPQIPKFVILKVPISDRADRCYSWPSISMDTQLQIEYRTGMYWKKSACKRTHEVQTRVGQGSNAVVNQHMSTATMDFVFLRAVSFLIFYRNILNRILFKSRSWAYFLGAYGLHLINIW